MVEIKHCPACRLFALCGSTCAQGFDTHSLTYILLLRLLLLPLQAAVLLTAGAVQ
jgi:hypothetical protein